MKCPRCDGFMDKHFEDVYICLKCKNKELATFAEKNN
jgi:ribosomal protein S27AE